MGEFQQHFFLTRAGEAISYYENGTACSAGVASGAGATAGKAGSADAAGSVSVASSDGQAAGKSGGSAGRTAKPTVLLIHGNAGSSSEWLDIMQLWQDKYHMIVPDLRGFGQSSYLHPARRLSALAEDLRELLDQLLFQADPQARLSIIGWSLGGGVAAELAAKISSHVDRLVLTASVGLQGYPLYYLDATGMNKSHPFTSREDIENSVYYLAMKKARDNHLRPALSMGVRVLFARCWPKQEWVDRMIQSGYQQRNLLDMIEALLLFNMSHAPNEAGAPGSGLIDDLTMPILIIHGTRDRLVPHTMAVLNHNVLGPRATLVSIQGASHILHLDAMDEWLAQVEHFLDS